MFQLSDPNAGTTYDLGINGASFTTNLKWIKKYLAQWLVKMIGQNYFRITSYLTLHLAIQNKYNARNSLPFYK